MAEWLVLPTSDHKALDLNLAGGLIQHMAELCFVSHSLSFSSFCQLDMTSNVERGIKIKQTVKGKIDL